MVAEKTGGPDCLPFADQIFDWIVSTQVWDQIHSAAIPTLLAACARVIKPGGWIMVAFRQIETGRDQPIPLNIEAFEQFLDAAGFLPAARWSVEEMETGTRPFAIFRRTGKDVIA